jgi:hypothetical protein
VEQSIAVHGDAADVVRRVNADRSTGKSSISSRSTESERK